jgi:UDP-glucose 4-epimerase
LQFNKDPIYCIQNTLDGFRNVLRLSKYHHAKLLYPSSGNVYGELPLPHNEYMNPKPNNLYGVCKFQCEQMAIDHTFGGFESTGLRVYAGYGYGEEKKGELASVVYQFLSKMIKGESPEIWGNGEQSRDFVFINDIVHGFIESMHIKASIINLGTGDCFTYNELVDTINEVLDTNIKPIYKVKPSKYVESALADTTLMRKVFKYTDWSLYDGITKFAEYLRWK